ncbi:MAG: hypothetical protein HY342_11200 [Candidatus Lambdaproteobacteria bacterium]|nr:hypothetical protein [Candidatus Lambdaproteobacteria bacterium]
MTLNELKWSALRTVFFGYIFFSLLTLVGGFLTAPIMTYYFFGDWRFWRHWGPGTRLFPHGWRMVLSVLQPNGHAFMFSVPLFSAPASAPDRSRVRVRNDWGYGNSCGYCRRCCEIYKCPVLDKSTGLCRGYDSFFWRYFNCGRFPTSQPDINFYACPKWEMKPSTVVAESPAAAAASVGLAPERQAQIG